MESRSTVGGMVIRDGAVVIIVVRGKIDGGVMGSRGE